MKKKRSIGTVLSELRIYGAERVKRYRLYASAPSRNGENGRRPVTVPASELLRFIVLPVLLLMLLSNTVQAAEYGAPAYGTKAQNPEKEALRIQVEEITKALQPLADTLALSVAGHNVQIENHSNANELGLIYQSKGSGVILAMDANFVYIATAAHCTRHENTVVTFADGAQHAGTVTYRNPARDVGFLVVNLAELTPETRAAISPATGMDAQAAGKGQGDMLVAILSADRPNQAAFGGTLDQYSVVYPNNPQQNVLQFYASVSYGSSGGAVYTPEGIWVGSVSGGDTFGTCWAVPYSEILEEFHVWLSQLAAQQE